MNPISSLPTKGSRWKHPRHVTSTLTTRPSTLNWRNRARVRRPPIRSQDLIVPMPLAALLSPVQIVHAKCTSALAPLIPLPLVRINLNVGPRFYDLLYVSYKAESIQLYFQRKILQTNISFLLLITCLIFTYYEFAWVKVNFFPLFVLRNYLDIVCDSRNCSIFTVLMRFCFNKFFCHF